MGNFRRSPMAFGSQLVRVAVDRVTGAVRIKRVVGAFACGRVINTAVLRGALIGGMTWGIGRALMKGTTANRRSGRWLNANLADALFPIPAGVSAVEAIVRDEDDDRYNRTGMKGAGELLTADGC